MSQHPKVSPSTFVDVIARIAKILLKNQSFSRMKRQRQKKKRCWWDGGLIKRSWSHEFWRTNIEQPHTACGMQLKPFYKLCAPCSLVIDFLLCPFPLPVEMREEEGGRLFFKHVYTNTHNPLYLFL